MKTVLKYITHIFLHFIVFKNKNIVLNVSVVSDQVLRSVDYGMYNGIDTDWDSGYTGLTHRVDTSTHSRITFHSKE